MLIMPGSETTLSDRVLSQLQSSALEDERETWYAHYRNYYDGEHPTMLTDRMLEFLQVKPGTTFCDNYCVVVVNAVVNRLKVIALKCDDKALAAWVWELWESVRADALQRRVHLAAVRDGDTYLIVDWDPEAGRPRMTHNVSYDSENLSGTKVHYTSEQIPQPMFASKRWTELAPEWDRNLTRLTLYYPDRVEKWVSDPKQARGEWMPYQPEGEPWPIPWVTAAGKPLGIPVFHFRNRDQGTAYGTSELKAAVPLQDALNKATIDLIAAGDTTAFRILTAIGFEPKDASTGEELKIAPGSWVWTEAPPTEAEIGSIEPADLAPLLSLHSHWGSEIARVTETPLSMFQSTRQVAAEGTLKQQEIGLIAKVEAAQLTFGNVWEDALMYARRLAETFGEEGEAVGDMAGNLDSIWAPASVRSVAELRIEAEAKKASGVPEQRIWVEVWGYDQDEVDTLSQMREASRDQLLGQIVGRMIEGGAGASA
jgi:hypothetical protein